MEKKQIIESLRKTALVKVRTDKKAKQVFLFACPIVFMCGVFVALTSALLPPGVAFVVAVCLTIILMIISVIILPLGKISEDKINEVFREMVSEKIKHYSEYLEETPKTLLEIEEELKILKEL